LKSRVIAIIIVVFCCLTIIFVLIFRKSETKGISAVNAIPINAAVVIKVNGIIPFLTAISENEYFQGITDSSFRSGFQNLKEKLDSITDNNSFAYQVLHDSSSYVSLHINKNKAGFLVYLPFEPNLSQTKILKLLTNVARENNSLFTQHNASVKQENTSVTANYYYYIIQGLLVIGNNPNNVNESLLQINNKKNLNADTSFVKVNATTGKNVQASIMVNFQNTCSMLENIIEPSIFKDFEKAFNIQGWAALDISIDSKSVSLHGFASVRGNKTLWLRALKNEQPTEFDLQNIMPATTLAYGVFSLSDSYNYKLALTENSKVDIRLSENIKNLRQQFGKSIDDKLFEKMGESFAYNLCELPNGIATFCIVKAKSSVDALDFVSQFRIQKKGKQQKLNSNDSEIINTSIQTLPSKNLPIILFGNAFKSGTYSAIANYKDCIIFGSSEENLKQFIQSITTKTLVADSSYNSAVSELQASKSNITIHFNLSKFLTALPIFQEKHASFIENSISNKAKAFAEVQISGNGDLLYCSSFLYAENKDDSHSNFRWSVPLDSSLLAPPVYIPSCNSKEAQFFILDRKLNIYLVSGTGKIIWKYSLDDSILGSAQIIDYFKNGKKQILFNTKNYLYLIDKLGKPVKGFPVKFKQPASNGVCVADFDANLNYRYYIAFANKSFVVLSKTGKKIDGWKFTKTQSVVNRMTQCFRVKNKDYIVLSDTSNAYILSRKGEQIIKLKQPFRKQDNSPFYIDEQPNFFRFVTTTNAGTAFAIYPDGHTDSMKFNSISEPYYFNFFDINSDKQNEYIFTDSLNFHAFSTDRKALISFPLTGSIDSKPYILNSKNGTVAVLFQSLENKKIWKTDITGKVAEGFPVSGNSPMNVISLSDKYYSFALFTTEGNNFVSYYIH
jgi:hypothetical protein